ncbi:MAG: enolase C-terminal domain-like protein [Bryobacter sp.]|nr:enolase C-terminal domain-like protein [Bryobacter sp.]
MKTPQLSRRQAIGAALATTCLPADMLGWQARSGMPSPKIKDVQVIATAPAGLRLVVVKIVTDQDGLYGYGCATYTQRADLVVEAVKRYLRPFLLGKPADRIDDTWQACYNSSYWRNSPVLNNAISGVDQALWDIKGRQAGMPVYQILGGKNREAVDTYRHAAGAEISECIDQAKRLVAEGQRHVRIQVGTPGQAAYGAGRGAAADATGRLHNGPMYEPQAYIKRTLQLFEAARKELGPDVELLHDTHERIHPTQALQMGKDIEQFRLFFWEDPVSPEDVAWFRRIRQQTSTPLAMGELFTHPLEWMDLVSERLIDFIRVHLSMIGGLTPARKLAALCEAFNVRTAWHGPGDVSPIGHACNASLDLVIPNFGIQEYSAFNERVREVFSGVPELRNGYIYVSEKPGWGIEVDEKAAAKYPFGSGEQGERKELNGGWGAVRRRDGTIIKQ